VHVPLLARWSSLTLPKRLRLIAMAVLVAGLAGAWILYRIETRSHAPTLDELLPGDAQRRARQTAILMGTFVVTLLGWLDALKDPATQAVLIAGASVLLAIGLYRVAWLLDTRGAPAHSAPPSGVKARPRFVVHRGASERRQRDDTARRGD
jgi:hypothetical protein